MNTSRAVLTRIVFLFFNRDMATECVRRALLLQGVKSGEKIPADVRESEDTHVKWPSLFDGFVEQMRTKQPDHQGVPCGEVCAFLPAAQPACTRPGGPCPSVNSSLPHTRRSGKLLLYTRRSSRSSCRTFLANSICKRRVLSLMRRGPSRTQGWLRFWDHAEQSHYYHHPASGQTSWEEPPGATAGHVVDPARDGPAHKNRSLPEAPAAECAPGAYAPGSAMEAPPGSPPGSPPGAPDTVPGGFMHAQCPPPAVVPPAPEHGPAVANTDCAYHDGYDWDAYAREYGCAHVCRVHAAVHCDCVCVRGRPCARLCVLCLLAL